MIISTSTEWSLVSWLRMASTESQIWSRSQLGIRPHRTLGIIGRYILTPDIFDVLRDTPPGKNGELQITDALKAQAQEGCVLAYRFKGRRFDCGSIDGFVEATNHCYEKFYKAGT